MVAVSVIVPLYNKAPFVARSLRSILTQTWPDFELLVVDDGSTDDGPEVVARCDDRRVRLIRQANAGPGPARNRGLSEARGEFVAFLDADDEWLPTYLEKSLANLGKHGPEVACATSCYALYPAGQSMEAFWRKRHLREGVYRLAADTDPQFAVHLLAYLSPCTTVARTEAVRRQGGFFDQWRCLYAEDAFLWLKVLLNEAVVVSLEPLAGFHTEASGLSGNLRGPRPVEPMLLHPEQLEAVCPPDLRDLLKKMLAVRAIKTACMLAYWGKWRAARALLKRFCPLSLWRLPRFAVAQVAATPLGAGVGWLARRWRG